MVSIFLNLLRLNLWPNIWPVLENVSCALEKNVYLIVVGQSVLYMSLNLVDLFYCVSPLFLIYLLSGCLSHY